MVLRQPMTADKMRDKRDKFGLAPKEAASDMLLANIKNLREYHVR